MRMVQDFELVVRLAARVRLVTVLMDLMAGLLAVGEHGGHEVGVILRRQNQLEDVVEDLRRHSAMILRIAKTSLAPPIRRARVIIASVNLISRVKLHITISHAEPKLLSLELSCIG